jgi:glycosyltransferase involved in cell wall biosynthesis
MTYHLGDKADLEGVTLHRTAKDPAYVTTKAGPTLKKSTVLNRRLVALTARLARELQFDVVHAHHVEGLAVARVARSISRESFPIVFDQHTRLAAELPYYAPAVFRRSMGPLGALADRLLPRLADHVTTVTDELRNGLIERHIVVPELATTIANGLEFDLFDEAARRNAAYQRGETLVFSGNLASYQGVDLMLRAFARVRAVRPGARLRVVTNEDFAPYADLADTLGVADAIDTHFVEFEHVPALLADADVALNPRLDAPGMPLKTLNYLAAGLPIVSFAGSGHHLRHEHTGLIVADGDIAAFADAILRVLADDELAAGLRANGLKMILNKTTWAESSAELEGVLIRTIDRTRKTTRRGFTRRVAG